MAEKKVRQVVPGLGDLNQLTPAADPRVMDSYVRPGTPEIQAPPRTNPLMQLSDALAKLEPTLQRGVSIAAEKYGKEEYAKGEQEFYANREKWNQLIRDGKLPEGASPYFQRGLQRAALRQQGDDFYAQVHADFYGPAGEAARRSNDPRVVQQFLQDARTKYVDEKMRANGKDVYSALDMQEVFNPKAEQVTRTMLQTHAAYRVAENEKEYEAVATAHINTAIDSNFAQIPEDASEEVEKQWIAQAARVANDALYNPDTGAVANGMRPHRGNEILIQTVQAKMLKAKSWGEANRFAKVLEHITNKDGAPISNTRDAIAMVTQAEEHVIARTEREAHFKEWQRGLQASRFQEQRMYENAAKEDERWAREKEQIVKADEKFTKEQRVDVLQRRIFAGLRNPDAAQGVAIIDEAMEMLEFVDSEKAAQAHSWVKAITHNKSDYPDDPMTVAEMRLDLSIDPLGFNKNRIKDAVANKMMKASTAMQMIDDLERNQHDADDPFMKQPEFKQMLDDVRRGSLKDANDEYGAEGRLRAARAARLFRDYALEWKEDNPNGSMTKFRIYMDTKVEETIERANATYAADQKRNAQKQESAGRNIQQVTSAEEGEKRQKEADKQEEQRKVQEAKEAPAKARKERDEKERKELEENTRKFKPSGKKTDEGRPILQSEDGSIVTERTVTIKDKRINDGRPTNIPTVYGGKFFTAKEAIEIIARNEGKDPDTGAKLRGWYSIEDAVIAARERSARLGKEYGNGKGKSDPEPVKPPKKTSKAPEGEEFNPVEDAERAAGVVKLPS